MVRALVLAAQGLLLGLIGYNAITALWGWRDRDPEERGSRRQRLRVVVPAHDEAAVIGGIVGDLLLSDYPGDAFAIWVIADRCSDATAAVAAAMGASVVERSDGVDGKGAALAWHLDELPLHDDEALVVFDADNRIGPDVLGRIADELDAGHQVVQCYLDVANPDDSMLTTAAALSYWASNRMVQLARTNLGWSADLGGTGMAFTAESLAAVGGLAPSLTEDQELLARLAHTGISVTWLHDVKIYDEKPLGVAAAVTQRARWMSGKRAVARTHLGPLWKEALARRSPAAFDVGLRLIQPSRMFVALVSGVLAVLAIGTRSSWLLTWPVWAAAAAIQLLEPIPFLAKDGVSGRYLVRYPLLAGLAALWLPIRVLSARRRQWRRTEHRGHEEA